MLQGRPGPVHLDVPLNVFVEETEVDVHDPGLWRGGVSGHGAASRGDVPATLSLLSHAERPVIVAGHGVELADASDELNYPATIGIVPERPVVAVVGDAGFPMLPSAVATAVEYDIPVIWLVWNKRGLHLHPGPTARLFRRTTRARDLVRQSPARGALHAGLRDDRAGDGGGRAFGRQPAGSGGTDRGSARARPADRALVDPDMNPASAATWGLPPLPHPEPTFGWPDA